MCEYTMLFLVINLGGEMLYILRQRLEAQKIDKEKSKRVLKEVTKAMFSEDFMGGLFKQRKMYTIEATKQVFDKLAHASIMRLSKNSMNKVVGKMTEEDHTNLKEDLLMFLKDKGVKVGVFLQKGFQNRDSSFNLQRSVEEIPYLSPHAPGTILYHHPEKKTTTIPHPLNFLTRNIINYTSFEKRTSPVGLNLYKKSPPPPSSPLPAESRVDLKKLNMPSPGKKKQRGDPYRRRLKFGPVPELSLRSIDNMKEKEEGSFSPLSHAVSQKVGQEYNYLASLLGGVGKESEEGETEGEGEEEEVVLDILQEGEHEGESEGETEGEQKEVVVERRDKVVIVGVKRNDLAASLFDDFEKKNDLLLQDEDEDDEEDLLALMDQAEDED